MNPRLVVVVIALLLVGGAVTIAQRAGKGTQPSAGPSPAPFTTASVSVGPNCLPLPKRIATPSWFPANLPLPPGSFAVPGPSAAGQMRASFAVKVSLTEFVRFVLREWKAKGWVLGRGEAEPGEAEDNFRSADGRRFGAFKARSIYCDPNATFVFFVIVNVTPSPTPTGS